MDEFYGQQYGQNDRQGTTHEEAMSRVDMSQAHDKNLFGRQSNGQVSTGMQTQPTTLGQNADNPSSQDHGKSRAGSNAVGMPQPAGAVQGAPFNNFSFGGGLGQNFMLPNAMFQGQPQANMNLVAQMINSNPMYASIMSNAAAAANSNATSHVQQPNGQMVSMSQLPMAANAQDPNMFAMMQNSMAPLGMMSNAQMMPNMMMNPMVQQNIQRPAQGHDAAPNGKPAISQASETGGGNLGNNPGIHAHSTDFSSERPHMSIHPYGSTSRRNSTPHSHHPSISQPPRRSSTAAVGSVQQSPTNINFPSTNPTQAPTVVPVASSGFPEYGGSGSAFATGGVHINPNQDSYRNAYSSTGFDMLTVLMRVATRKSPIIDIGNVDLSCAFVVCDTMQHDIPIVYCSENFERLTGYSKHEILGRNCRFLQAPSSHVQAGVKRKYVDDDVVLHLKNAINSRTEAQVSVINYRKGGQPFMNLLTMIPIPYDTDEMKYYVGFQVDLVEQPHSVTKKNPNGTYTINYQRGLQMPRYIFNQEQHRRTSTDSGQTIPRDEVSTVLSTIGSGESDLSRRIWDKVLLENTDDVIFVLSLKGLFLYLSPSCRKILEYDANELMGTALSSVCHPSDIVPVTRELKDTTTGITVSVVFRIRRKENGYMWFEGHGSLYIEQGKGRKSIVLVGRERPVYTLKKTDILANGGVGENEVWTKLSTSGMFLYVSSSIRGLLDKQPSELVGTSIQSLMRPDSRSEFGRILEIARSGKRAQTRHELVNRRGQVLQAFSTVHPGDATEGSKPTFFVAQTRLLKYTRPTPINSTPRLQSQQAAPGQKAQTTTTQNRRPSLSRSVSSVGSYASPSQYMSTFEAAATYAGGDSLPLGHQDAALADELNLFDELKTTRSTSWQYELRQMEKRNRVLAEELQSLLAAKKKRKRRKPGVLEKECANCHTKQTPEWRRGPSGNRDLCNSCGLRWAKQQGRISPRTTSQRSGHSAASDPRSDSPRGVQGQSAAQQRRASGSAAATAGEKELNAGQSMGESRGIDETLAQSNEFQPQTGQGSQARTQTQQQTTASSSTTSPPASKATKVEGDTRSPLHALGASIPTKIEEED